ncbi:hypothetical protein G7Y89_g6126 [Cudoniella acicularis]|uniref:Uncharacterized protein n=1 Tax=Cudoniella acicularis TaxID=354080 RepID=A0A8H4RL38_9HELO|nr:hypothetical protein G7Y89_g6126 [Cudoniella acicularis]
MKGRAIDQLVYECMFPKPKSTDPQNFQGLLQRQLVPEVRLETQAFYGHLSSQEAKYPGLDYSYGPHRVRLSRYQWHRRLFRAFDNLGLTKSEIASLTKWEGTRWAKERFEREQGIKIRDTTGDGIEDWIEPELRVPTAPQAHRADVEDMEDIQEDGETEENEMEEDGEDSDVEIQSVGIELNERLRTAAAQREAGNVATVMDEEWEQWLKEAAENGGLPFSDLGLSPNANIPGTRPATDLPAMNPQVLNAARLGQWQQIPEFLHNIVRQNIEAHNRRLEDAAIAPIPPPASTTSTSSASSTTSSPFLSRPSLSPRARAVPATSTSSSGRIDTPPGSRLDNHFADQFSRRSNPALLSVPPFHASRRPGVRLSVSRSTQQNNGT